MLLSWFQQPHQSFFSTDQHWNAEQTDTSTGAKLLSDVFILPLQMQLFVLCKSHSSSNALQEDESLSIMSLSEHTMVYRDYLLCCGHLPNARFEHLLLPGCMSQCNKPQHTWHQCRNTRLCKYWAAEWYFCVLVTTQPLSHTSFCQMTHCQSKFWCTRTRNHKHCLSSLSSWVRALHNCCYLVI